MPFDFKKYDEKCQGLTVEELQREWQHYTRLITGAATSTTVSGLALPLTMGVSTIGIALAAPAIHNARLKREIVEKHLNRLNTTHVTRKRDVLGGVAVSGTIGVVTLGVGTLGADAIAAQGAEHGISAIVENDTAIKIVTHAALDGAGLAVEHKHTSHVRKKEARKAFEAAGVFQAVQDAKAAEAGYSVHQPYNPQTFAGPSSSSLSLPPPPPPYSPGQAPSYFAPVSYGTAPDTSIYSASAIQSYQYPPPDETTAQQFYPPPSKTVQHTYEHPVSEKAGLLPTSEASYQPHLSADTAAFDMSSMNQTLPALANDTTGHKSLQQPPQDAQQRSITPADNQQGFQPHLGFPPEAFSPPQAASELAPSPTPQPFPQSIPQTAPQPQPSPHFAPPVTPLSSSESMTPAPLALSREPSSSLPPRSQTFPTAATPDTAVGHPFPQPHTPQPVAGTSPQPPAAGQQTYGMPVSASQPLRPHLMAAQIAAQMAAQMSPPPPSATPDPNTFRRHSVMTPPSTHSTPPVPNHYHRHSIAQPAGYFPPAQAAHVAPAIATYAIPEEPQYEPVAIPQAYHGNQLQPQPQPQPQPQSQTNMFPPTPMSLPTSPSNLPSSHRHSVSYFPPPSVADKGMQPMYFPQQSASSGVYHPQHMPYTPGATPGSQVPSYQ